MMEMSFRSAIELKVEESPARLAVKPKILTYRYPGGFKTGIYRYRLVSIGRVWYRLTSFMRYMENAGKPVLGIR